MVENTGADELEQFRAAVRAEIEANGWHVVLVPRHEGRPAYGFTLGLTERHDHPELCVVGLDEGENGGLMHDLLDSAAEHVAGGGRYAAGQRDTGLLVGHTLAIRTIDSERRCDWLALAAAHLGRTDFEALQFVWPDRRGRLPTDPSCDHQVVKSQPLLD